MVGTVQLLPRRWPLLLIVVLFLAGCMYVAWRIHSEDLVVEEAYAQIQVGMTGAEVFKLLEEPMGEPIWFKPDASEPPVQNYLICTRNNSAIQLVFRRSENKPPQYVVVSKDIHRPTWLDRLQRLINGW